MQFHYFTSAAFSLHQERIISDFSLYANPGWTLHEFSSDSLGSNFANEEQWQIFRRERLIDYLHKTAHCEQACFLVEENIIFNNLTFKSLECFISNAQDIWQLIITDCELDLDYMALLQLCQDKYNSSIFGISGLIQLSDLKYKNFTSGHGLLLLPTMREKLLDLLVNFIPDCGLDSFFAQVAVEKKLDIFLCFPYITWQIKSKTSLQTPASQSRNILNQAFYMQEKVANSCTLPWQSANITLNPSNHHASNFLAEIIALKLAGNLYAKPT